MCGYPIFVFEVIRIGLFDTGRDMKDRIVSLCLGLTNTQTAQPAKPPDNSEKWTSIVIGVIVGLVVVIILSVGIVVFW